MHISEFINLIPKAELHLHIEGSFEPELMFQIAERNKRHIPYKSIEELKAAYTFDCLQDFLDIYHQGAQVLLEEADFYDLTMAYLTRVTSENVLHTEIMIDTQTHTDRGVPIESVIHGIRRACMDAKEKYGITSLLILSFLRHLSEEAAFQTYQSILPFKDWIACVGLASSEKGNPPSKFSRVYAQAIKDGFIPVAHAGEEGPPSYIWEALNDLNIIRIDHGNRCLEDENLVQEIKSRNMALTVCPLSNTALQVIDDMENHPLKRMMEMGVKVTVNSDDPAYFGGYMIDNFNAVQSALNLDKKDIYQLARNSFEYSFLPDDQKAEHMASVDKFYQLNG
jgi:adenosine deaminase